MNKARGWIHLAGLLFLTVFSMAPSCEDGGSDDTYDDQDTASETEGSTSENNDSQDTVASDLEQDTNTDTESHDSKEEVTQGLISHYAFDGDGNDLSGNGLDCVAKNGLRFDEGIIGQAAVFDGEDDYFSCAKQEAHINHADLSIAMWIKVEERENVDQYVMISNLGSYMSSGGYQLHLGALPQGFTALFRADDHADRNVQSASKIEANTWRHLVATYKREEGTTTVKNYIDGVLDHFETIQGTINYDAVSELTIGTNLDGVAGGGGYDREFQGSMDDVRLYSRALSDAEAKALYELGS